MTKISDIFGAPINKLNYLDDVDTYTTSPSADHILRYSGTEWTPSHSLNNLDISNNLDVGSSITQGGNLVLDTSDFSENGGNVVTNNDLPESLNIWAQDPLRKQIEAATGGMCTVLYDDFDLPNYMRIIPAMNAGDLISGKTGLHPAFLYGGVQIPEIFVGMYQAVSVSGRAVSQPGIEPWVNIDFDAARSKCSEKGAGWHLMTNWEWAAVALWIAQNGWQPRGNTDHGRAHDAVFETGVRQDGDAYVPGDSSGVGNILCGSGPFSWRHDQTAAGVADLVGNVWEWNDLLKTIGGRVYMADDNEYDLSESSWSDTGHDISDSNPWSAYSPSHTSDLLELALIVPVSESDPLNGRLYVSDADERMARRGGARNSAGHAGPAALGLYSTRSDSSSALGFRPAFVLKP